MMLDELRAANPVPEPLVVDGAALYARITALPGDPRLQRRAPRRRRWVVAAVAFAGAAVVASAAYGVSSWLGAAVRPPVTLREYREAQTELTLPPGYSWPVLHLDNDTVTSPGAGGGHAVSIAMVDWECYWAAAIRSHDLAAQTRAHDALETLLRDNAVVAPTDAPENWSPAVRPHHPVAVFADDGGYQYKQRMYARAAAGDPRAVVESCRANG